MTKPKSEKQLESFLKNRNSDTSAANMARTLKADEYARAFVSKHGDIRNLDYTNAQIAKILYDDRYTKPGGHWDWDSSTVRNLKKRIDDLPENLDTKS